jgi:acyl carrier protein phosphodiesterase
MNFLAHAYLAGPDAADRLGGLMGDFVKGPLPAGLPAEVAAGVRLHRAIDSFADGHEAFRASRARISAPRRRAAGIVIDMFYDHFLARRWAEFAPEPLEEFSAGMYLLLDQHAALLPERLGRILPAMRSGDWLASYRHADSVGDALERMARRLSRPELLLGAGGELAANYAGLEDDFRRFMRDAQQFAAVHRAARRPDAA